MWLVSLLFSNCKPGILYLSSVCDTASCEQSGSLCYSPSPATIGITMPLDEKDRTANEEQAKNSISLDSSQPITTVQIRLADGSRLLGQFNHSHTIADVRRFITTYPLYKSPMIKAVKLGF